MKLQDIPIEQRYYGNSEKTQGREVREGKFEGATEYWCPYCTTWQTSLPMFCGSPDCRKFWSRPIDVGEGCRLLKLEESVEIGDEHFFGVSCGWIRADAPRGSVLHEIGDGSLAFAYRRRIESKPGEWVSVDERCPWKSDADENGCVLALRKDSRSWRVVYWVDVANGNYSHWMKQPPLPPPEKSEAEIAYDATAKITWLHKGSFLAGFAAGKGQK